MIKIIRTSTVPISLNIFCRGVLHALNQTYEVIALSSPGPELQEIAQREQVRTIEVSMCRNITPLRDIWSLVRLIRIFAHERPTVVHSMTPKAGLLCMVAAKLTHVPIRMHTFTGLIWPTAHGWKRRILILTDRITCKCATHRIAEGEGVKQDLQAITSLRIDILGYGNMRGIDLSYYVPSTPHPVGTKHFLFVGRVVADKGIDELLEAFDKIYQQDKEARLTIVGPMEENKISTRQAIIAHPGIRYVGAVQDVRPYYEQACCLVLPSYREGFPNVVLEAGAMELPCIVTDINGSREIVVHQETGLIIPAHDADSLYQAMQTMIQHPDMAHQMGKAARQRIAQRWEAQQVRNYLEQYYQSAICSIS